MTVTAVIASYNRSQYLVQSVESILNQTVPVSELIVVDDGSTEDTEAVLSAFASRISFYKKQNGGRATALNYGLERARGDWVWFFDDDDVALPDALERLLGAVRQRPSANFVYSGNYNGVDGSDGEIVRSDLHLPHDPGDDELLVSVLLKYDFRTQGMLIRRSCFDKIGAFDPAYLRGQDYELTVRLLREYRGVCLAQPTFIWRLHSGIRGPKGHEHNESERELVWQRFDGMLGRKVRQDFALGEYLIPRTNSDDLSPAQRRTALITRMAIMASKGLVAEMLDDMSAVVSSDATVSVAAQLTPLEHEMCKDCVLSPYFLLVFLQNPDVFVERLKAMGDTPLYRQICAVFCRSLLYAARDKQSIGRRVALLRVALRIFLLAGPRASLGALRRRN